MVPVLFWTMTLTQFPEEISMHMAVATSLITIIFTSLSSAQSHHALGYVFDQALGSWGSLGYVSLPAAALILPFTVLFAPLGAAVSHRIPNVWVKRCFAIFLGITGLRMLFDALT